jgi:hypothetical protein
MTTKSTERDARSKKPKKLTLNKETLVDLNVKSGDSVKGGVCKDTDAQTCACFRC